MDPKVRERFLIIAAAGLGVLLLVGTGVSKVLETGSEMEAQVAEAESDLRKMRLLVRDLTVLSHKTRNLERVIRQPRFALLSHLDTIASREGLPRPNMKPRNVTPTEHYHEESVEVKFQKLTLGQVVAFLNAVEHSRPERMRVTYLDTKARFDDASLMDATLHVSAYFSPDGAAAPAPDLPPTPPPADDTEPEETDTASAQPESAPEDADRDAADNDAGDGPKSNRRIIQRERMNLSPEEREKRRQRRDERKALRNELNEQWRDMDPQERRKRLRERLEELREQQQDEDSGAATPGPAERDIVIPRLPGR